MSIWRWRIRKKEFFEVNFDEKPSVLNEITNDYKKENLDSSAAIDLIFPKGVKLFFALPSVKSSVEMPNIVFMNAPDNLKGDKKIMNILENIKLF